MVLSSVSPMISFFSSRLPVLWVPIRLVSMVLTSRILLEFSEWISALECCASLQMMVPPQLPPSFPAMPEGTSSTPEQTSEVLTLPV